MPSWKDEFSSKSIFLSMSSPEKSFLLSLAYGASGALVEVLQMAQDKVELFYNQFWALRVVFGLAGTCCIRDGGATGLCYCGKVPACDWTSELVNVCIVLGARVGIRATGICISLGMLMGGAILGFLLIPALPCPILGLGIGSTTFVGSLWSIDFV